MRREKLEKFLEAFGRDLWEIEVAVSEASNELSRMWERLEEEDLQVAETAEGRPEGRSFSHACQTSERGCQKNG